MISKQDLKLLIDACLANDRASQKKLFDLTSDKVMTTCSRYCNNKEDARDLFQDAYIKIFKYLGSFNKESGDLLGWIYIVTKNCIISHFNNKKIIFSSIDDLTADDDNIVQFDQSILQQEEILKEIQNLPEGYRTILNMFVFESMDHSEIASILKISESTSRSQLSRARKILKNKLESLYTTKYEKFII